MTEPKCSPKCVWWTYVHSDSITLVSSFWLSLCNKSFLIWKCDRYASRTDFQRKGDINHLLIWHLSTLLGWISPFWIVAICICLMNSYAQHVILQNHMKQTALTNCFSSCTTNKCKNMGSNLNARQQQITIILFVFSKTTKNTPYSPKHVGTWSSHPYPYSIPKPWVLTISWSHLCC